ESTLGHHPVERGQREANQNGGDRERDENLDDRDAAFALLEASHFALDATHVHAHPKRASASVGTVGSGGSRQPMSGRFWQHQRCCPSVVPVVFARFGGVTVVVLVPALRAVRSYLEQTVRR